MEWSKGKLDMAITYEYLVCTTPIGEMRIEIRPYTENNIYYYLFLNDICFHTDLNSLESAKAMCKFHLKVLNDVLTEYLYGNEMD